MKISEILKARGREKKKLGKSKARKETWCKALSWIRRIKIGKKGGERKHGRRNNWQGESCAGTGFIFSGCSRGGCALLEGGGAG